MVRKIIYSTIFVCLCIAIPLAMMGYERVELGTPFLALMRSVNLDLENFKIAIPDIPTIPVIPSESSAGNDILSVLISIANGLIGFINVLINIINVLILQVLE